MKRRVFLAAGAGALLPACGDGSYKCLAMGKSPQGVRSAFIGKASGFDPAYVDGATFDAVERAIAFYVALGDDPDWVRGAAYGVGWLGMDNCCFLASDYMTWASGEYVPACNQITMAIYRRVQKNDFPIGTTAAQVKAFSGAPWHTIRANPRNPVNGFDQWRWGELEVGFEFRVAEHELGHRLHGPNFGHKACVSAGCALSGVAW